MTTYCETIYCEPFYTRTETGSDVQWSLTDAQYVGQSPQLNGSVMRAIDFSEDGTRAYIVFRTTEVARQFNLSQPYDVLSASPAGNGDHDFSGYIATGDQNESVAHGFFIRKTDGMLAWIWNRREIWEVTLSTAWDITTASQTGYFSLVGTVARGHDVDWKSDGTRWFVEDRTNGRVYQFDCSTAWDVESSTAAGSYVIPNVDEVRGIELQPDGLRMFLTHTSAQEVREYHLSTAWDVTTASLDQSFDVASQSSVPVSVVFRPDGTEFFVGDSTSRRVHVYDFTVDIPSTFKPYFARRQAQTIGGP
jgi:hypothetical protein